MEHDCPLVVTLVDVGPGRPWGKGPPARISRGDSEALGKRGWAEETSRCLETGDCQR